MGGSPSAGVVSDSSAGPLPENLLDGLTGSARAERAELVPWLMDQGITAAEIRESFSPMLLPARRALGDDGRRVSARQIGERAGVEIDELIRFMRAAGLPVVDDPDAAVFGVADCDVVLHLKRFVDFGVRSEQVLTVVRVLAEGLSHAADVMRHAALEAVLHPGVTELEIARQSQQWARVAAPMLGPMIQDILMMQLRHTIETEAVTASERAAGAPLPGARHVGVAFADLVGFTSLGETVPPDQLERMANRLADYARDGAVEPVHFIKTIGDAVMLVSADAAALLDAMLALVEVARADDSLPPLRAGVAYGAAVTRAGDWFGSPVNQASRITSVARAGSVLVSEAVREQVEMNPDGRGHIVWSPAGSRHLKGVPGPVRLLRARVEVEPDRS